MKPTDYILRKLKLMRKAEADEEIRVFRRQADHDSKLAGDLVLECQNLSKTIDELTEENSKLRDRVEELRAKNAVMQTEIVTRGAEADRLRDALDEIRIRIDDAL